MLRHMFIVFSLFMSLIPLASADNLSNYIGQNVSLESLNFPGRYIRHRNFLAFLEPVQSTLDKLDSSFYARPGLANTNCVSLESVNHPNYYLRHSNFRVRLDSSDGSQLFRKDATFCSSPGLASSDGVSLVPSNFGGYFVRHRNFEIWIDRYEESDLFRRDATFRVITN
jgi:hypothetical protein